MVVLSMVLLLSGDPPVIAVEPVPLVYAGEAQGNVVLATDQAAANKGLKPLGPFIADVADRFDQSMVDYPSARFRSVSLGYRDSKKVMCGYFNAKNRMGAYVGWAPFFAVSDGEGSILRWYGADEALPFTYKYHCEGPTAWLPGDHSATVAFH